MEIASISHHDLYSARLRNHLYLMIIRIELKAWKALKVSTCQCRAVRPRLRRSSSIKCRNQPSASDQSVSEPFKKEASALDINRSLLRFSTTFASPLLAVLEGTCLAAALLLQFFILRAAKVNQHGIHPSLHHDTPCHALTSGNKQTGWL